MIKKFFIAFILILFCINSANAFSDDDLARLEYSRYGEAFENQSLSERLNRLETDIFGMAQSGSVDDRVSMLAKISDNNFNSRILSPSENFYPGVKQNKIKSIWNNITEPFSTTSSMTGFTPSWNSSGYGYSNNMYRNEFLNFLNDQNKYCPYHNRYHNTNRFFNRRNPANGFLNSNVQRPYYHNNLHNHNHLHNRYPYNRNYYNQYTPPNITTGTSVHIIKD